MDDLAFSEAAAALYKELIGKVIDKQPLSDRESIAYHVIDFGIRLETGALDGIIAEPRPYVEALQQVGLTTHATLLGEIVSRFPQAEQGNWKPEDADAWQARDEALSAMSDAHQDDDSTPFDRAAYMFWKGSEAKR